MLAHAVHAEEEEESIRTSQTLHFLVDGLYVSTMICQLLIKFYMLIYLQP